MKHFRIIDSFRVANRWHLGSPRTQNGQDVDPRIFTCCVVYQGVSPLVVPVKEGHVAVDFTLGAFDMPVVTSKVGELIEHHAPGLVQRIPLVVGDFVSGYEALNVLTRVDRLDERRSLISYWTADDGHPEKVGQLCGVARIVLKPRKGVGVPIFRLAGWELPIIIDARLSSILEEAGVSGIEFEALRD